MLRYKCRVRSDDYPFFHAESLPASDRPYFFRQAAAPLSISAIEYRHKGHLRTEDFHAFMESSGTTLLILIKDGDILFERYYNGHQKSSVQRMFSITKSFVSALVGKAIEEGHIGSVHDPVRLYIPELQACSMTIRQLLLMDAGIRFREGRLPWRDEAKVFLHPDARRLALTVTEVPVSGHFHYNDYHPLLLGIILERTTGTSVTEYFCQKIWRPLGMQYAGRLIMDSRSSAFEKLESGLVMTALDLAKFGAMYLNKGMWEGRQIIPQRWVEESVGPGGVPCNQEHFHYYRHHPWGKMWFRLNQAYYKYLWWGYLNDGAEHDYFALGALGQVLYVSPGHRAIAIRTGKKWGVKDWWPTILSKLIHSNISKE
jgi:CubicO group peptidase (beta-lactamase class C family)